MRQNSAAFFIDLGILRTKTKDKEGYRMNNLEFSQPENPLYEITLLTKNHKDEVTGKRNFKTNDPYKLWEFYQKHNAYRNLKKKRKKKGKLPTKVEADKLMKEAGKYADNKQQQKQQGKPHNGSSQNESSDNKESNT